MFRFTKKLLIGALTFIFLLSWSTVSSPTAANAANAKGNHQKMSGFQSGAGGQWMLNMWLQLDQHNNGVRKGNSRLYSGLGTVNNSLHYGQGTGNNGLHPGQWIGSQNDQLSLSFLVSQVADILDANEQTIIKKLQNGSSMVEIAKSYDVDESTLLEKLEDLISDEIDNAVASGAITDTQASEMESKLTECLEQVLERKLNSSVKTTGTLGVPDNLEATAVSDSEITLEWNFVSSATSYYVYRAKSKSGTYTKIDTVTGTSYKDDDLTDDTTYYYKVQAHNSKGTSNYSSIVYATTGDSSESDLDAPDDLSATAGNDGEIALDWDSVSGAASYYVYRSTSYSGIYVKIVTVTATSYTDNNLMDGTTYYYKVKARSSSDTSSYSSIVNAVAQDDDLTAPDDLTATAGSSSKISLDWDSVNDATSYYVYRSSSYSGTYSKIVTVTTSSYTDTGLSNDTTYYYKVKAHSSSDTSGYSSVAHATTD
jgi:fibronectin type 3 domain-containing protein